MTLATGWAALRSWIEQRDKARALSQFTCDHCDRSSQCGRPPSEACVEKYEQVYGDDSWRHRPASRLRGRFPYE